MNRVRVWLSRVVDLVSRRGREARLSEEIQAHLDLLTEQYVAQGMRPADARAAARREFGGIDQMKERYRDQRGVPGIDAWQHDLRFAVRLLRKDRRFTLATVFALGLGLGAVNAVFTLVNTMLFRELPFAEAERLVALHGWGDDRRQTGLSYTDYEALTGQVAALEAVAAHGPDGDYATILDAEDRQQYPPERVRFTAVSANTFDVLGWSAAQGRVFRPEDDLPGAPSVTVISDELWRRRYGADPSVIGRSVLVDDVPSTIVGVMPPRFTWPMINQLWQPLGSLASMTPEARVRPTFALTGRLRRDATLSQVNTQLDAAAKAIPPPAPPLKKRQTFTASFLKDDMRGGRSAVPIVLTLMGIAGLVLAISCANVASLLLSRSMTRAREIAIRTAVGASRWRIVRQVLIESLVLASIAGILGVVLSRYGAQLLATGFDLVEPGMPNVTPFWVDLSMDGRAYLFVVVVCFVTTMAFGLGPALYLSRANTTEVLKDGGRSSTVRSQRVSGILVACEIALALVLMATAGVMWRTFITLYNTDLVIDTSRLTTMRVMLPTGAGQSEQSRRDFVARLDERLAVSHRLASVTLTSGRVIGSPGTVRNVSIAGQPPDAVANERRTQMLSVGDRFFETIGLPVVRGRVLGPDDGGVGREVVVVNEEFVAQFLAREEPIGQRIQLVQPEAKVATVAWHTIVGVSRTVPSPFVNQRPQPVVYVPFRSEAESPRSTSIIVRDAPLATAAAVLREEIRALNPSLALHAIEPMDVDVARGRMAQKLLGTWLGILAAIGLVLASVGVFALTAHNVVQRTQEIGVRMALGAPVSLVIWMFLRRSLTHLALGVLLGTVGALFVGKLFGTFLVSSGAADYPTTSLVLVVLIVITTVASLLPARRAAKVDPLVALRHE